MLGALNFVSKKITTVTNDSYITSTQVCELLKNLAAEYIDKPVCLILDNASYQKCHLVRDMAAGLGINLIFIPPYSPNLNLIERFWKFTKGKLRTKYYTDFNEFIDKIDTIIGSSNNDCKKEVDNLITEKVQLFDCLTGEDGKTNPIISVQKSSKLAA